MGAPAGTQYPLWRRVGEAVTGPWTRENFTWWVKIIVAILFLKGCVIDQYRIPSESMDPTLHGDPGFFSGDRVLVNKWVYGPRVPFTTMRLWNWAAPSRWDIVVFRNVDSASPNKVLIKRVVGLPGETVHIEDGHIRVNGERIEPPPELADVLHYTSSADGDGLNLMRGFLELARIAQPIPGLNARHAPVQQLYRDMERVHPRIEGLALDQLRPEEIERLCEGVAPESLNTVRHMLLRSSPPAEYGIREEPQFSKVPEDHYFLLGDNSANSRDGRYFGWVPRDNLYGRAFAIWWPWNRRRDFSGFSTTWWGMALLYGIPALIIAFEARNALRRKRSPG